MGHSAHSAGGCEGSLLTLMGMKITDIEVITLRFEYPPERRFTYAGGVCTGRLTSIVRVETNEGVSGIGSAYSHPDLVRLIVEGHLREVLIGADPLDIEGIWRRCHVVTRWYGRQGCAISALGAIDVALWDIRGKTVGEPVSVILGRVRSEVPAYASGLLWKDDPAELAEEAQGYVQQGFRAMKARIGKNEEYDRAAVSVLRKEIGEDVRLMVDGNCRYTPEGAQRLMPLLRDMNVFWLEEPFVPEALDQSRALRGRGIPLAAGENECGLEGFERLIECGAVDIVQPDASRTGGISEAYRIGSRAQREGLQVAPHTWSDAVAVVANMHVVASLRNGLTVELDRTGNPFIDDLLTEPLAVQNGLLTVPDKPGLGIDLNWDTVERYRLTSNTVVPPGNYSDMAFGRAYHYPLEVAPIQGVVA